MNMSMLTITFILGCAYYITYPRTLAVVHLESHDGKLHISRAWSAPNLVHDVGAIVDGVTATVARQLRPAARAEPTLAQGVSAMHTVSGFLS